MVKERRREATQRGSCSQTRVPARIIQHSVNLRSSSRAYVIWSEHGGVAPGPKHQCARAHRQGLRCGLSQLLDTHGVRKK